MFILDSLNEISPHLRPESDQNAVIYTKAQAVYIKAKGILLYISRLYGYVVQGIVLAAHLHPLKFGEYSLSIKVRQNRLKTLRLTRVNLNYTNPYDVAEI